MMSLERDDSYVEGTLSWKRSEHFYRVMPMKKIIWLSEVSHTLLK